MITRKQFNQDVHHEATMLRKHMTDREKNSLDFEYLDPDSWFSCIYGQATGDCYSIRATNLIKKCCIRMSVEGSTSLNIISNGRTWAELREVVNGPLEKSEIHGGRSYFSAIEMYITLKDAKNKSLLAYIKGDRDTWKP